MNEIKNILKKHIKKIQRGKKYLNIPQSQRLVENETGQQNINISEQAT